MGLTYGALVALPGGVFVFVFLEYTLSHVLSVLRKQN